MSSLLGATATTAAPSTGLTLGGSTAAPSTGLGGLGGGLGATTTPATAQSTASTGFSLGKSSDQHCGGLQISSLVSV